MWRQIKILCVLCVLGGFNIASTTEDTESTEW